MINPDSPTPFLQFHCVHLKTTVFENPPGLDSPLEAYSCIGRVAKAYGLPYPEIKESLQEMISDLKGAIDGKVPPNEQIEKVLQILLDFNRDDVISDKTRDIVEYAYEHEK